MMGSNKPKWIQTPIPGILGTIEIDRYDDGYDIYLGNKQLTHGKYGELTLDDLEEILEALNIKVRYYRVKERLY